MEINFVWCSQIMNIRTYVTMLRNSIVPPDQYNPGLVTDYVLTKSVNHNCSESWFYDFNKTHYRDMNLG